MVLQGLGEDACCREKAVCIYREKLAFLLSSLGLGLANSELETMKRHWDDNYLIKVYNSTLYASK